LSGANSSSAEGAAEVSQGRSAQRSVARRPWISSRLQGSPERAIQNDDYETVWEKFIIATSSL